MGMMSQSMYRRTLNRLRFVTNPTNIGASLFAGKLHTVPVSMPEILKNIGRSDEVACAILDRMGAITMLPPRGAGRIRLQAIIHQTLFLPYNDFWITDPERN